MTDSNLTPVPSDPPMTLTPLLTEQGFSVCGKFASDLADLCNAASQAGMTPVMISGQLGCQWALLMGGVALEAANTPAPVAPAPAPIPAPPPPTLVLDADVMAGGAVTLTLGDITAPTSDMQLLTFTLGAYSVELKYTAHDGFIYTVGSYWPGVTIYGKAGDMIRMAITDVSVYVDISQDGGANWATFHSFTRIETLVMLHAHVDPTTYVTVNNLAVTQ